MGPLTLTMIARGDGKDDAGAMAVGAGLLVMARKLSRSRELRLDTERGGDRRCCGNGRPCRSVRVSRGASSRKGFLPRFLGRMRQVRPQWLH